MEKTTLSLEERCTYGARQSIRKESEASNGYFVCNSFTIGNVASLKIWQKPNVTDEELHVKLDQMGYPKYLEDVDPVDLVKQEDTNV
ncbi:hypothetical protein AVT69_gp273 [Pseudomonas phage PhiPA3]|uniref:Uncharacterized protein 275 n=1 Tax=Pseudomonas phage PhiPA3 TaxID=998086 RepID=F8SJB2_BPPA3|nr:hypothetical protein AVT69_gp273 [Pseudomonas phage PhiPA3]AEH03698.1 hypothetical protein [Pseudomonas phage PhiPA3]